MQCIVRKAKENWIAVVNFSLLDPVHIYRFLIAVRTGIEKRGSDHFDSVCASSCCRVLQFIYIVIVQPIKETRHYIFHFIFRLNGRRHQVCIPVSQRGNFSRVRKTVIFFPLSLSLLKSFDTRFSMGILPRIDHAKFKVIKLIAVEKKINMGVVVWH